jgi:superfamily I DNA and/or RNA helicase
MSDRSTTQTGFFQSDSAERLHPGSHPEGAETSALQHLIGKPKMILPKMGLLLPEAWRIHPKICEFASKIFYEDRLSARPVINGSGDQ